MFEIFIAVVTFVGTSWAIMTLLCLLVIVWKSDPQAIKEYRRLKALASDANNGLIEAKADCEREPNIKILPIWNKMRGIQKRYSVHRSALYSCFGFY